MVFGYAFLTTFIWTAEYFQHYVPGTKIKVIIQSAYLARRLLNVPELEDHGHEETRDEAGEGQRQADLAEQAERHHEPHLHGPVLPRAAAGPAAGGAVAGCIHRRRSRRRRRLVRILGRTATMTLTSHSIIQSS